MDANVICGFFRKISTDVLQGEYIDYFFLVWWHFTLTLEDILLLCRQQNISREISELCLTLVTLH